MYFGSPMSAVDQLQYNAHRIYGFMRLPLMTAGWEVVGVYERGYSKPGQCGNQTCDGLFSHWQKAASPGHAGMQPLVVLRNRRTTPCEHT
jgi:hypothetical protein